MRASDRLRAMSDHRPIGDDTPHPEGRKLLGVVRPARPVRDMSEQEWDQFVDETFELFWNRLEQSRHVERKEP